MLVEEMTFTVPGLGCTADGAFETVMIVDAESLSGPSVSVTVSVVM
jgi:hypothetical protein